MLALGLGYVPFEAQRRILSGGIAADLALICATRAEFCDDSGAIALAAWAASETAEIPVPRLLGRLSDMLLRRGLLSATDCSWILTAALAAGCGEDALARSAAERLVEAQSPSGLFLAGGRGGQRTRIACFTDQAYAILALARFAEAFRDRRAMAAAERCALRICALQGKGGQWWPHYEVGTGDKAWAPAPGRNFYQQALGPLALLQLWKCGGSENLGAVVRGLEFPEENPGINAGRSVALAGSEFPGKTDGRRFWRWLETISPLNRNDQEYRPGELGLLLYTWLSHTEHPR